jgi:hypothetical protein
MPAECNPHLVQFQGLGSRRVEARFDGGPITSYGGLLLLHDGAAAMGLFSRLARCFVDHREQARVEHTVEELLAQRILAICLGEEDLNDHDRLCRDVLLATVVGKVDPTGSSRPRARDRERPLASSSTLNRLEWAPEPTGEPSRYRKIESMFSAIERLFVELAMDRFERAPERIVLDADATDDRIHGKQEGRFFHGYYGHYCYLPLYVFWDDFPVVAKLRSANIDGCAGIVEELERVVGQLRERWPEVEIWVRADSGFARDNLMSWCEDNGVHFVLGLAKNARLKPMIECEQDKAAERHRISGRPEREFAELRYRTRDTWSRERRVVGKAEQLPGKANPRFVVTSLPVERFDARTVYEKLYAVRGEMENRIKEQQLDLFADRTSAHIMRANQMRLWLSTFAYILIAEVRRVGLVDTEMERAQAGTIRTRLLLVGAAVKVSVRRVYASLSSAFPHQDLWCVVAGRLREWRLSTT